MQKLKEIWLEQECNTIMSQDAWKEVLKPLIEKWLEEYNKKLTIGILLQNNAKWMLNTLLKEINEE